MKHIVWIQSNDFSSSDYYFVDGKLIPESDSKTIQDAVSKLIEIQGIRKCSSKQNVFWRKETGCPYFTLAFDRFKGFLFKSLFNEIADDGRHRGFVCYANSLDVDFIWEYLTKCSSSLGYSLRDSDYQILTSYLNSVKKRYQIQNIIFILISLIIITIFLIWMF